MLHQTAIELFAPPCLHDLGRTSAIPTVFLHRSPQPLMARVLVVVVVVVVVVHTKLNIHPHSSSFCHCRPCEVGALVHQPQYGCYLFHG